MTPLSTRRVNVHPKPSQNTQKEITLFCIVLCRLLTTPLTIACLKLIPVHRREHRQRYAACTHNTMAPTENHIQNFVCCDKSSGLTVLSAPLENKNKSGRIIATIREGQTRNQPAVCSRRTRDDAAYDPSVRQKRRVKKECRTEAKPCKCPVLGKPS